MTFPEPRYIVTWGGVGWQDWEGGYRWRWTLPHLKFSFGAEHFLGRAVLEQGYFLIPVLPEIGKISRAVRAGNMRQRKMLGLSLQGKCFLVCVRPVSERWKGGTHLRSHLPVIVVFIANGLPSEYTSFHCKYCLSQWEIIRLYAPHFSRAQEFSRGHRGGSHERKVWDMQLASHKVDIVQELTLFLLSWTTWSLVSASLWEPVVHLGLWRLISYKHFQNSYTERVRDNVPWWFWLECDDWYLSFEQTVLHWIVC